MQYIMVILYGLCFGSCASLLIWRLPRGEPCGMVRSRCPKCKKNLGLIDLMPVLSWVLSLGKCRHCQQKISFFYPAVEIITACGFLLVYLRFGLSVDFLIISLLFFCLLVMLVIDLQHYILPDSMQICVFALGIIWHFLQGTALADVLYGAAAGLAVGCALKYGYIFLKNQDGLGLGDVKFLAIAGMWLGLENLPVYFFLSGVLGIITGLLWRLAGRGRVFPFGPALIIAMLLLLIFPTWKNMFKEILQIFHYI